MQHFDLPKEEIEEVVRWMTTPKGRGARSPRLLVGVDILGIDKDFEYMRKEHEENYLDIWPEHWDLKNAI